MLKTSGFLKWYFMQSSTVFTLGDMISKAYKLEMRSYTQSASLAKMWFIHTGIDVPVFINHILCVNLPLALAKQ